MAPLDYGALYLSLVGDEVFPMNIRVVSCRITTLRSKRSIQQNICIQMEPLLVGREPCHQLPAGLRSADVHVPIEVGSHIPLLLTMNGESVAGAISDCSRSAPEVAETLDDSEQFLKILLRRTSR